jgi:hypothetical protein
VIFLCLLEHRGLHYLVVKVFTYYDSTPTAPPNQAELIRVWAHSWEAQGWTPRLLTVRHARASRLGSVCAKLSCDWIAALEYHGGGFFCSPNIINFSFPGKEAFLRAPKRDARFFSAGEFIGLAWIPRGDIDRVVNRGPSSVQTWPGICTHHREPGWETSKLVHFDSDFTLQQILDCGRRISLC